MVEWYNEFGSVFFITITTIVLGVVSLCVKTCLKSKCNEVECLCFKINRDTDTEEKIEEMELKHTDIYRQHEENL